MQDPSDPVLKRMAAPRQPAPDPAHPRHDPTEQLALALARAAQEALGLPVKVTGAGADRALPTDLAEADDVEEGALFALLEGAGGASGLMILGAPLLAAVLAQRLTGRLPARPPAARPPTRIDSEMARGLIDGTLGFFAEEGPGWARGWSCSGMVSDARLLRFSLADTPHERVRLDLAIGSGEGWSGRLTLVLPSARVDEAGQASAPDPTAWAEGLASNVMQSDLAVEAVLARLRLPLAQIAAWHPGTVLALPPGALDAVRLETGGRALVAAGRLGRAGGARAVRLDTGPLVAGQGARPALRVHVKGAPGDQPDAPFVAPDVAAQAGLR